MKSLIVWLSMLGLLLVAGCGTTERAATVKQEGSGSGSSSTAKENKGKSGSEEESSEEPSEDSPQEPSVGDLVEVGAWDVRVTDVELNANTQIAQANQFNEKPAGQYVLVTYKATYTGDERTADTLWDLTWSFTTTDSKVHDQATVVTPADRQEWTTQARQGGTVKQQVVFDLPKNKVKGGILTVETMDENFDTVYADFRL